MTLTNYWWLLIWLFIGGGILAAFIPKQKEIVLERVEKRWETLSAFILILPYIIWAGFRSNNFGDSLLSSKLQKNLCEFHHSF